MECGICMASFDFTRRRPKMFPCGHSACLACLQVFEAQRCPECQLDFSCPARDLPDNFTVLKFLESSSRRTRMWCEYCKTVAKPDCFGNHTLSSFQTALEDEVVQLQVHAALLAEDLPDALRVDDDVAREQALRVLELARQPGTTLEVTVRGQRGEASTATWMNPPAAPTGHQGTAEGVGAVATDVLVLALAKKGLWQQRDAQQQDGAQQRGDQGEAQAQGRESPDQPVLQTLESGSDLTAQRKDELLRRVAGVRRLTYVLCDRDPAWSLQLLQLAAPHVEELQVFDVRREHLLAVHAMPRLRRLLVTGSRVHYDFPDKLPPLPAHHVGLRWLGVDGLPRKTTFSLMRRHAATLEEVLLWETGPGDGKIPRHSDDLPKKLARCGFSALRRLVLGRPSHCTRHARDRCSDQLSAVRGVLPGVLVQCKRCEAVDMEF